MRFVDPPEIRANATATNGFRSWNRRHRGLPRRTDSALAMIDLWLSQQDAEDGERPPRKARGLQALIESGRDLTLRLEHYRDRDRDILEPDLIYAIDRLNWEVSKGMQFIGFVDGGLTADPAATEREALRSTVEGAKQFAAVFGEYAPEWMVVLERMRVDAKGYSEEMHQHRTAPPVEQGPPTSRPPEPTCKSRRASTRSPGCLSAAASRLWASRA